MRDAGRFLEAKQQFFKIAHEATDPIAKLSAVVYNVPVLSALGEFDAAEHELRVAQELMEQAQALTLDSECAQRRSFLEVDLDFEIADLSWAEGKLQDAEARFDTHLRKHADKFRRPEFRFSWEVAYIRRAFVLADMGRWQEAPCFDDRFRLC